MKKIHLLAFLTLLPGLALAQTSTNTADTPPGPPPHGEWHHHLDPDKELAHLTEKLQLTTVQQGQIKPILVAKAAKLKTIHDDASLSEEQKHEQSKTVFDDSDTEIEAVLTSDQVAEFKAMHQHHGPPPPPQ